MNNLSSLEKFYEALDHFLEVAVLLNELCSRTADIDDLEIKSLRYFFVKI